MEIAVRNDQKKVEVSPYLLKILEGIAVKVLEYAGKENSEVSIVLVDDAFISELNKQFRGIDQPTDVLSFPMEEEEIETVLEGEGIEALLGDVVISMETASRQAKDYNHSLLRETCYLTVHGILHLLGYDHKREKEKDLMRSLEEKILQEYDLDR